MRFLRRLGFTLVELLVVIAIIGILIALLLPAVQAAREAARRSQCTNNLKQLGLALHNYHDAFKIFPAQGFNRRWAGGTSNDTGYKTDWKNHNGFVSMLPYLEQQSIYDQYDFSSCASYCTSHTQSQMSALPMAGVDPMTSGNAALVATQIAAFICPSDPGELLLGTGGAYGIQDGQSTYRGVKTNYDFNSTRISTFNYWYQNQTIQTRYMFGENSTTRVASVLDGLSNTVAICETLHDCANGPCPAWGYRVWVMSGIDLYGETSNPGINVNDIPSTWAWVADKTPRPSRLRTWSLSGSMHPGGVNACLGDGSVRFISETTDTNVLLQVSRMADGSSAQVP